jgi:hypothetical protein
MVLGIINQTALHDSTGNRGLRSPTFECEECKQPVLTHKASSYGGPFEHRTRNATSIATKVTIVCKPHDHSTKL